LSAKKNLHILIGGVPYIYGLNRNRERIPRPALAGLQG